MRSPPMDPDSEDDFQEAVVMAINSRHESEIGCCYFTANEGSLFVMSDIRNGSTDTLGCLKAQIQPTVIILPLQISEQVELCFQCRAPADQPMGENGDGLQLPYVLEYRPSAEFSDQAAKRRLFDLPHQVYGSGDMLVTMSADRDSYEANDEAQTNSLTRHGRYLSVSTALDFGSRMSLGCAGAVLAYLIRHRSAHQLSTDEGSPNDLSISHVKMFRIKDLMFINEDTQTSLQILQTESSPNTHSQGPSRGASGEKEGLSIFGLFKKHSRTSQGRQRLRQLLSQPTLNSVVINERLDSITLFIRPENQGFVKRMSRDLAHIKNLRAVLGNLKKGIGNVSNRHEISSSVWSALRSAAYHALQLKDAFTEMTGADRLKIGSTLLETFRSEELSEVGRKINAYVDFEKSEQMNRVVIADGIDPDLDSLRRAYNGMEHMLNRVTEEISSTVPDHYVDLSVIFFPQIGFLIRLPLEGETSEAVFRGEGHGPEQWDLIFTSAESQYFKNASMRDLDSSWGDVYASICDKEIELVHDLAISVLPYEGLLNQVSDVCGDLDCLLALTTGARCHGFQRPQIVSENVIIIKGGRHPLQELCIPSFVPNDTLMVGGRSEATPATSEANQGRDQANSLMDEECGEYPMGPSMVMVTGPNFSGKSVYLKQTAIIVYLTHVGSLVPAEKAVIGLTDAILTRVSGRDTVSRMQSTFMVDLQQSAMALKLATSCSLVLLDELGKGTEVSDGIGIASGVYQYLLSSEAERPKVLAATHLHELFETDRLVHNSNLAFRFMDVDVEAGAHDSHESIVYLYTLREGRSNASHGTQCAARNGIDSRVVQRAIDLGHLDTQGEDLVAACATISDLEEQELRIAEEAARDFLAQNLEPLKPR